MGLGCGRGVEVKGLRIIFAGEFQNLFHGDLIMAEAGFFADFYIFEIKHVNPF